jgi:hypothetical protein
MTIEKISELDWFNKHLIVFDYPEYIFSHPTKRNYIAICCDKRKPERLTAAPPLSWHLLLNVPQTNIYIETDEQILRDRLSLRYLIDGGKVEAINANISSGYIKVKNIMCILDSVALWYCRELTRDNRQQKIYNIVQRNEISWAKYFIDCPMQTNALIEELAQKASPNNYLELVEIDIL